VRRSLASDLSHSALPADTVDDALLVATELVTNSIRHATAQRSGYISVRWLPDPDGVTVSVTDGGSARRPELHDAPPDAANGRGLSIIAAVSDGWGVAEDGDGVTVWAHLPSVATMRRTAGGTVRV
jgi:anti-sigma regulatory factor (Ser/Thr protein kinase)